MEHIWTADKAYYTYAMIVHTYEKSYKGDSELNDYFRFKMAESANLRMDSDGINNLMWVVYFKTKYYNY